MFCWGAMGRCVEARLLQGKIPFRRLVGVVDQHEAGIVLEAFGLLDHRDLILADKLCSEEFGNRCEEWDVVEDVPRGDDVDAAGGRGDGCDGGERGEPLVAGANDLGAAIGQGEVDGGVDGLAVDAEEFVGRGVGAGRVGAHAKAFGDGLEALGFFANAGARTPPPRLVDEGSVGRVHKADDAVIDVAGQVGGEESGAETGAEFG